jgi:GNAT superfamily N-acetyltransferase
VADASILPEEGEYLTTGWEPDLDPADTLVRQAVEVFASLPVAVAQAAGRPWRRTPRWAGAWLGDRGALTNTVALTQPADDLSEVVAEAAELIPPHVPYALMSPWPTSDLRRHGLALVGHPPLMVRLPGPPPERPRSSPAAHEVLDADRLAAAERVLVEGYPMPELLPLTAGDLLGRSLLDGDTRVWLADVDGEPAATAVAHTAAGVTLVEFVATMPAFRGRGAGAAVTWAATLSDPRRPAVLLASDDGRPVYERMGYFAVERWTVWLRLPQP